MYGDGLLHAVTMRSTFIFTVCLVVDLCDKGSSASTVRLETTVGKIIGKVREIDVNGTRGFVREFLGIPYAKPPVGDLRFSKPEVKEYFRLPFNATQPGPICPQAGIQIVPTTAFTLSEDCLNLNIYTPSSIRKESKLSVLVFIHGGAFVTGAANLYAGDVLSFFGDVIVVIINYRLSIFGFLSTKDSTALGNFGLWDQHLALKWVNTNIASFGGDPGSVTLIGQSVGAISAIYQSMFVGNKGLFHRVIAESGTAINFGALYSGLMLHDVNFQTLGHMTGCSTMTSRELVTCLRRKDKQLIRSSLRSSFYQIPFGPVFDGDFIRDDPRKMLDKSIEKYADVRDFFGSLDLLIGGNSMEGAVYLSAMWKALLMVNDLEQFNLTENVYRDKVIPSVLQQIYGTSQSELAKDAVFIRYSDIIDFKDGTALRNMLLKLTTDYMFKVPNLMTAKLHSELNSLSNTFVYEFTAKSSLVFPNYATPSWVTEANHGDEAEFVFGFSRKMLDSLSVPKHYHPKQQEVDLSSKMMKLWTNFAKTGFPNNPDKVRGCPVWKKFDYMNKYYLELSTDMSESSMKTGYAEPSGSFWFDFMPKVVPSIAEANIEQTKQRSYEGGEACGSVASDGIFNTKIAIIVVGIVAGLLGVGFLVSVYCGLNIRKRANATYDAVEM